MPRPQIGKISQAEMAEKAGISPKTLREWRDNEGIDITDEAQVMERAAAVTRRSEDTEDMNEAKLRKLSAEASLAEHKLQVQRGEYVRREEVLREGTQAGLMIRGLLLKSPDDLTPKLAGKTSGEIADELERWSRETLLTISSYKTPLDMNPENEREQKRHEQ